MMTRVTSITLAAALFVAASAGTASAQLKPFTMSDMSNDRYVGAELMIASADFGIADVFATTLEVVGEFALGPQFKLFGRVPLTYVMIDVDGGDDDSEAALGNVQIGGRFNAGGGGEGGGGTRFGGFVSVALPTAPDDGDGAGAVSMAAFVHLPHDPGLYLPDSLTVRLGGDIRVEAEAWFFQGELALHQIMFDDDDAEDLSLLRIAVGGGAKIGANLALVGDLSIMSDILEDDEDTGEEDFIEALDLGARWKLSSGIVSVRLYLPLDEDMRDADIIGIGGDFLASF